MSTPFSEEAAEMLDKIGVNAFKIASCDITNYPLLTKVASFNKPILLSTGASNIEEIRPINKTGLIDGITTNPSLLAKQKGNFKEILKSIASEVKGPISAEVTAVKAEKMITEAKINEHFMQKREEYRMKSPDDIKYERSNAMKDQFMMRFGYDPENASNNSILDSPKRTPVSKNNNYNNYNDHFESPHR